MLKLRENSGASRGALGAGILVFIAIVSLTGGGARGDIQSLLILRPISVIAAAVALILLPVAQLQTMRTPLIFLSAWACLMALQLVPLPPGWWTALPGREIFVQIPSLAGFDQPWRPISISPIRTWNSLVSLVVPFAAMLLFCALPNEKRHVPLTWLIGIGVISSVLALLQLMGPPSGPLYLYRITNEGSAVGLFANRNHQSVYLASIYPMLSVFSSFPGLTAQQRRFRLWLSAAIGIFLLPLIVVTGSRAGLAAALIGIVSAGLLYRRSTHPNQLKVFLNRKARYLAVMAGGTLLVLIVAASRMTAVTRVWNTKLEAEFRFELLSPILAIVKGNFPFGTGFGSFDRAYRIVEPFEMLQSSYLNHAHNDLVEILVEGGLCSFVILCCFIAYWSRIAIRLWRAAGTVDARLMLGRLGTVVTFMLMLASLVDYPLRIPLLAVLYVIALGWMVVGRRAGSPARQSAM